MTLEPQLSLGLNVLAWRLQALVNNTYLLPCFTPCTLNDTVTPLKVDFLAVLKESQCSDGLGLNLFSLTMIFLSGTSGMFYCQYDKPGGALTPGCCLAPIAEQVTSLLCLK